jgi:hypothetical protein
MDFEDSQIDFQLLENGLIDRDFSKMKSNFQESNKDILS